MKMHLQLLFGGLLVAALVIGLVPERFSVDAQSEGVPNFDWDPLFFQDLPNRWTTGQVGGISIDSQDHIWVAHRPASVSPGERSAALSPPAARCCTPAPPVLEFDQNGKFVKALGGPGTGYEWPTTEHGVYADHKGNIWVAGNGKGDNQLLKFSNSGKFLLQIGKANQSKGSNDTANVYGAASMVVYPKTNELFVADGYTNRRVIVYDADTGAYKRHWGAYGKKPYDDPAPPYDPAAAEDLTSTEPRTAERLKNFATVHCAIVSTDGFVYVCDRANDRIQVFRKDGAFVKEAFIEPNTLRSGSVWDMTFSRDPQQTY